MMAARVLAILTASLILAILVFGDRDIPPDVLEERYANEASRFVELADGTRAHIRDQGIRDGEVLVLVHGSNASLHTWEPWVALLGDSFRLITLDLPGHGLTGRTPGDDYSADSMAGFVDEVTRKLGAARFHLAGNSMGGRVAWRYALDHPERLDKLILIDASGFPAPPGFEESLGFRLAVTPGVQQLMLFITPRPIFAASLRDAFSDPAFVTDEMVTRYHELQLREGSRKASLVRYQLPPDDPRIGEIAGIRAPTLVLWGENDRLIPVADAQRFESAIPDCRVRIYPGVGHVPMQEAAAASAADVAAFLRGEPWGRPQS